MQTRFPLCYRQQYFLKISQKSDYGGSNEHPDREGPHVILPKEIKSECLLYDLTDSVQLRSVPSNRRRIGRH